MATVCYRSLTLVLDSWIGKKSWLKRKILRVSVRRRGGALFSSQVKTAVAIATVCTCTLAHSCCTYRLEYNSRRSVFRERGRGSLIFESGKCGSGYCKRMLRYTHSIILICCTHGLDNNLAGQCLEGGGGGEWGSLIFEPLAVATATLCSRSLTHTCMLHNSQIGMQSRGSVFGKIGEGGGGGGMWFILIGLIILR